MAHHEDQSSSTIDRVLELLSEHGLEAMAKQAESGAMFNVGNQPLRRIGRPEDIANLALFFASDRAEHLTGQVVSVSGGSYMP